MAGWRRVADGAHRGSDIENLAGTENKNAGPLRHGPAQIGQPQFHSMSEVRHAWNWNEMERN
jgi:hypothetical protein